MKAKSVTSHDVAKLAGVSRSTVSLVLNGSNAVSLSEETKERVREAARILGYRPNSAALMLRKGRTDTIGLVITETRSIRVDAYIPILHYAIADVLKEAGYSLLLETFERKKGVNPYTDLVFSHRIDGLMVLSPHVEDKDLHALLDSGFPVVQIGSIGHPEELSVTTCTSDSTTEAVRHIVDLGHRNIGSVPFSPSGFSATDSRLEELRQELLKSGIMLDADCIEFGDFSAESGYNATLRLMKRQPRLTAIFAGNDTIALGVIGALNSLGLSVPGDVSVVGYDDLPFSGFISPPLTTVKMNADHQGRLAADLMVKRLKGETIPQKRLVLPSQVVLRDSTAKARMQASDL
ncbi:LacI family DNA-binding transcriptional regulator [Cohaesibacter marisflavi]|uniref:LacI family DNA-binding transcriptional regulator n=1 Tax=Cohaesibacter marisflavi TaxID=655353 RepID=UPI0029C8BBCE|nr:LacI family DNA-binding transcriptional regulator [Cohaesibacter marisflavi]